jgi:hypothetical protein
MSRETVINKNDLALKPEIDIWRRHATKVNFK